MSGSTSYKRDSTIELGAISPPARARPPAQHTIHLRMNTANPMTRRELFGAGLGMTLTQSERIVRAMPQTANRPKLAVILTSYGPTSHGLCYCTKLLEGKQFDDHFEEPRCEVVAMHLMEKVRNDIGVETARRHNVPLYQSV